MIFDIICAILCFVIWIYSKNKLYILLGIGMICGMLSVNFVLWEYGGYTRRVSIFIYILFIVLLSREERK